MAETHTHVPGQVLEIRTGTPSINDVLFDATFNPNRAVTPKVRQIDLDTLYSKSVNMRTFTREDKRHREIANFVFVMPYRGLLDLGDTNTGRKYRVHLVSDINPASGFGSSNIPKNEQQDRFIGMSMHTHPHDTPQSAADLSSLFRSDNHIGAATGSFVITPKLNIIVFRGERTPQWDDAFILEQKKKWRKNLNRDLREIYNRHSFSLFRRRNPQQELKGLMASALLFEEIVQEYDLKVFTGRPESRILSLQTA